MTSARRIVASYRLSFEHPSEKEKKLYLKKHPKADPRRHTVKAPEAGDEAAPEPEGKPQAKSPPPEAGKAKGFLKSLSSKAKAFLDKSSDSVKQFFVSPEARAKAIKAAKAEIMKAPGNYARRLVKVAKHEIHEFKEAGIALGDVMRGKKLDDHQKKTVKKVAIHLGIAVTAAALTSTGLMAGVVALGKGLSQKVAIKAALDAMEHLHTLNEVSHIGHGLSHVLEHGRHFLASDDQLSPEEAFTVLVMRAVFKQLESLDKKMLAEALESANEGLAQTDTEAPTSENFQKQSLPDHKDP